MCMPVQNTVHKQGDDVIMWVDVIDWQSKQNNSTVSFNIAAAQCTQMSLLQVGVKIDPISPKSLQHVIT